MKPVVCFAVLAVLTLSLNSNAQITSARQLTRRLRPNESAAPAPAPAPSASAAQTAAPAAPTDPAKAAAMKEEANKKALESQKKRAAEGSANAQYDLGMRYLRGDGVEKNEETARKWLTMASTNGLSQAEKELKKLDQQKKYSVTASAPASAPAKSDKATDAPQK